MAEKPEVANQLEGSRKDEEKPKEAITDEETLEQSEVEKSEVENTDVEGKDEVDTGSEKEGPEGKRKKSGILRRLSARKKKSRKDSKDETHVSEKKGKTGSNSELDDNNVEETEEKSEKPEEKVGVESDDQVKDEKECCAKTDKPQEGEMLGTDGKKKKPGRLRRLSFSKIKKSKKQGKTETKDEEKELKTDDIKNGEEEPRKLEDKSDGETLDSVADVQIVHKKCQEPETAFQSDISSDQPITIELQSDEEQEQAVELLEKELRTILNDSYVDPELIQGVQVEYDSKTASNSYVTLVISLPSDIAHKAVQTLREAIKPVIIYLIKKHPHCFKDVIENNKKITSRRPTQI